MLIRFEVENFRSIDGAVELSTVATDEDREAARRVESLDASLLTTVGIFGPNASGKSNVLAAIDWLRHAVGRSLVDWEDAIPVEPFEFGGEGGKPTSFVVEYLIEGVRFEYQLEVTASGVLYEGLFHYPVGRRKRIFERHGLQVKLQDGLGELAGVRKLITERSLVLSVARRFREDLTLQFASRIIQTRALGLPRAPRYLSRYGAVSPRAGGPAFFGRSASWLEVSDADDDDILELTEEQRSDAKRLRVQGLALLQMADLGIVDAELREEEPEANRPGRRRVLLVHEANGERYPLEMSQESAGTRTWFGLVGPLLETLSRGGILIFDEIDASLHPKLSAEVLGLFASAKTNPRNAQLIFTSHDPSLLARLNRDQIWLTDKDESGATSLTPLTDFGGDRVRKSQNLEKAYLEGRFGGVPEVDLFGLYHALGLVGR